MSYNPTQPPDSRSIEQAYCPYSYRDDYPPIMKDKSKNAARNRREKENGNKLKTLTGYILWFDSRRVFWAWKNVATSRCDNEPIGQGEHNSSHNFLSQNATGVSGRWDWMIVEIGSKFNQFMQVLEKDGVWNQQSAAMMSSKSSDLISYKLLMVSSLFFHQMERLCTSARLQVFILVSVRWFESKMQIWSCILWFRLN